MISSKRFLQNEKELAIATKTFVQKFSVLEDSIVKITSKLKKYNEQIGWTILGTVINHDIDNSTLENLLVALIKRFPGNQMWTLPVPKAKDIEEVMHSVSIEKKWSLEKNFPGVFWSVGFFIRKHENLKEWISKNSVEEIWRDLGEIYFMGKKSIRPKAVATIFRLCSQKPLGLGFECNQIKIMKKLNMPLTMGARRFLSIVGPAREDSFKNLTVLEKQKIMNDFAFALYPENPYMVAHSLQFYLEKGVDSFICSEFQKGCKNCPLFKFCSYGGYQ